MKTTLSLQSLSSILRGFRYGPRLRPVRDWSVLLAIALVLLAAGASFAIWLFVRIERGEALTNAPTSASAFDTTPVEEVRALFSERAAEALRFKNEYRFVDPRQAGG